MLKNLPSPMTKLTGNLAHLHMSDVEYFAIHLHLPKLGYFYSLAQMEVPKTNEYF